MDRWRFIKYVYKKKFNYPDEIVEFLAVIDIVKKSCMGYSNKRIAHKLQMEPVYIELVLTDFLGFTGWNNDLLYSPLALYKQTYDLDKFRGMVYNIDMFADERLIDIAYTICKQYFEMKEKLDRYDN